MRQHTPIHPDARLNDDWLKANGFIIGVNAFYNAIRDGSGRYNGYALDTGNGIHFINTLEDAEQVLTLIQQQKEAKMASPIMKHFAYAHLPEHLQKISMPFGVLAKLMDDELPDGEQKAIGLQKLLEAKDCMVRANLESKPQGETK